MSQSNPIRIFASHGWQRDEDYVRLFEYLESTTNFYYVNVSDPETEPAEGDGVAARRTLILEQMKQAEVMVVLAGVYERERSWAEFEVTAARAHELPVIAIEHFGARDLPQELQGKVDQVVGWDSRLIEDALRMHARHEDTARWDVIEFDPK